MPLGFSKACRTCLTLDGTLISIYDSDGYDGQGRIKDMIEEITTITPMKTDGLPELVCQTCFNEINRCFTFKVKCINSDSTLRKLFAADEETGHQQVQTEEFYKNQRVPIIDSLILLKRAVEQPAVAIKTEEIPAHDSFSYFVITPLDEDSETEIREVPFEGRIDNVKIEEESGDDCDEDNTSHTKLFTGVKKDEMSSLDDSRSMHNDSPEPICVKIKTEPIDESIQFEAAVDGMKVNSTENQISPSRRSYQCPKCEKVFLYISRLKEHLTAHSSHRPFKCTICDKSFKQNGHLKSHIDINHRKIKRFECKKCNKLFSCNSNLQGHMKTHNKMLFRRNNSNVFKKCNKIEPTTDELTNMDIYENDDRKPGDEEKKYFGKQEDRGDSVSICPTANMPNDIETKTETAINESFQNTLPTRRSYRPLKDGNHSSPESTGVQIKTRSSDRFTPQPPEEQAPNEINDNKGVDAVREYTCTHCPKVFKYISRLNEHLRSHSSERPFDCHICGKNFKQINHVMTHIKLSHKKKPFKCAKCIRCFASRSLLKKHLKTHISKDKAFPTKQSLIPEKTLNDKQYLEEEQLFDNEPVSDDELPSDDGKPFDDGESFNEEQLLNMEQESLFPQTDNNTVDPSDEQQTTSDGMKKQQEIETQHENIPKPNDQQEDDHTTVGMSSSRRSNRAKKEVIYSCDAEETPPSHSQTKNETDKKDDDLTNNFECPICKRDFFFVSRLTAHMRSHSEERPFPCSMCNKSFKLDGNLQSHIMICHKKLRPYNCSECSRTFSCTSNLRKHLKIHNKTLTRRKPKRRTLKKKNQKKQPTNDINFEQNVEQTEGINEMEEVPEGQENSQENVSQELDVAKDNVLLTVKCQLCSASVSPDNLTEHMQDTHNLPESTSVVLKSQKIKNPDHSNQSELEIQAADHSQSLNELKSNYKCTICDKLFPFNSRLKEHMRTHSNDRPFECSLCDKSFKQKCHLKSHILINHKKLKPFKCTMCFRTFSSSSNLKQHMKTHFGNGRRKHRKHPQYTVEESPDSQKRLSDLNAELKNLSMAQEESQPKQNLEVDVEDETEVEAAAVVEVEVEVIEDEIDMNDKMAYESPVKTPLSSPNSTNQSNMLTSDTSHPIQCLQCNKVFSYVSLLSKHLKTHSDERPYACLSCEKTFKQSSHLKSHIMIRHKKLKPFKCQECFRLFSCNSNLTKHMKTHNGKGSCRKPKMKRLIHRRNITPISEFAPIELDIESETGHELEVEGNIDFNEIKNKVSVSVRDTESSSVKSLQEQPNSSKLEKQKNSTKSDEVQILKPLASTTSPPFQCYQCNKEFTFISRLNEHMRTHSDERPFICSICGKTFKQNGHLKTHIMISHDKFKPYKCEDCPREFSSNFNLQVHLKTHCAKGNRRRARRNNDYLEEPHNITSEEGTTESDNISQQNIYGNLSFWDDSNQVSGSSLYLTPRHSQQNQSTPQSKKVALKSVHANIDSIPKEVDNSLANTTNPLQCHLCNKVFTYSSALGKHLRTHSDDRPYVCSLCGKTFKQSGHLKSHVMISHDKIKPYKCEKCFRDFSSNYNRKVHKCKFSTTGKSHRRSGSKSNAQDITSNEDIEELLHPANNGEENTVEKTKNNPKNTVDGSSKIQQKRNRCSICYIPVELEHLTEHIQQFHNSLGSTSTTIIKQEPLDEPEHEGHPLFDTLSNQIETGDGSQSLHCTECNKEFTYVSRLTEHMRSHSDERPFICTICNKSFKQKGHLKSHIMINHKKILPYKCNECLRSFPSRYNLKIHLKTHRSKRRAAIKKSYYKDPPYHGKTLSNTSPEHDQLLTKENTHEHTDVFLAQDIINKTIENQFALEREKVETARMELPQSSGVQVKKEPSDALQQTENFLHGTIPNDTEQPQSSLLCLVCGKTFERQGQLRHHIMMKHGKRIKPFKCKECPRAFSSKFNLKVHHQNHHVVKETSVSNEIVEIIESSPDATVECNQENHQCLFCPKELLSLSHLKEHMKIHTSDQPFICSLCGKGFNNDTELSAHLITSHNRSEPFKCDICAKTYKSSTGLKNHLVIHSDYRQQMRKAIRAERKQKTHTEAHESVSYSEQGLPQCKICKKEFTNNWVLKDHMKSHTNEKPFVCPICEKGFNKKYNLKIHVMAHKKIKPFKCDYCNQSFCTNAGRRIHHRSHMRNNDQTIAVDAINNS